MKSLILLILFCIPLYAEDSLVPYHELLETQYSLFAHKRTYLIPVSYITNPNESLYEKPKEADPGNTQDFYQNIEAEFQISFFFPINRKVAKSKWDLLFAYNHHAWWQIYNSAWSKPFRETNYTPELFFRHVSKKNPREILGMKVLGYDIGYIHQSNGQVEALSRSWDRLFARTHLLGTDYSLILSAWVRLPENRRQDDNSDIFDYMGTGEIHLQRFAGIHTYEVILPLAIKPGVEFRYSYPWQDSLRWFFNLRFGYGHSLIEYDQDTNRIGLGITLENFLDKR